MRSVNMRANYIDGVCPDCNLPIPEDAENGSECVNCGHVFWECTQDDSPEPPDYSALPHPMEDENGDDIRRIR
jgi:hypothetical protein